MKEPFACPDCAAVMFIAAEGAVGKHGTYTLCVCRNCYKREWRWIQ